LPPPGNGDGGREETSVPAGQRLNRLLVIFQDTNSRTFQVVILARAQAPEKGSKAKEA
jgi:hypothetical protein